MVLIRNLALKAALLFAAINLTFAVVDPAPALGRASIYNWLVPGRPRLPFGETPDKAYNFSLFSLEAMLAAHEISGGEAADGEYRVLVIGDSSVWGTLLRPEETLAGAINAGNYRTAAGRRLRAYNLGYPTMSLVKDVMLLERLAQFEPDLVVWLVTLESFPANRQLVSPIVQNNAPAVRALIAKYQLALDPADPDLVTPDLWRRTLVGQRRNLADLLRLQLYGVPWAATGVDQFYPADYPPTARDLAAGVEYYGHTPPRFADGALAFDVLRAGLRAAGPAPVLVVNEPIFVSSGLNSQVRYNFFYPRWAYDDYRARLAELARRDGWAYLDVWDQISDEEFTNSPVHLTPNGSARLAARLAVEILKLADK